MTAGRCSRCAMVGSKVNPLYTYEGTTIGDDRNIIVCKDLEACFYRVGILFRQFQTSRNLDQGDRGWHDGWIFQGFLMPVEEEAHG